MKKASFEPIAAPEQSPGSEGASGFQADGSFDRLRLIVGEQGLRTLADATVMVLGLGGVGSNCAVALARGGVGHLVLVDEDEVELSNVNRQAVALHSTIGRPKAQVMEELVHDINPACNVTARQMFIDKDRIAEQLGAFPRPDWVVDAIDTVAQKLRIALWCQERGLQLTSSTGAGNKLDPTRLRIADISQTHSDPMAKTLRKECHKRGIERLEVVFSEEIPMRFDVPQDAARLADGRPADQSVVFGTMSYMPAMMGYTIAGRVICGLLGLENPNDAHRSW